MRAAGALQREDLVTEAYLRSTGIEPEIYASNAVNGAEQVLPDASIVPAAAP